jgi:hypothetical protein
MTRVCEKQKKYAIPKVKRLPGGRSDKEIARLMERQARVMDAVEKTRGRAKVSVVLFAVAAGISPATYFRVLSCEKLARVSTIAKIRHAQRKAAAGALT